MKENPQTPVIVCEDWYEFALHNFVIIERRTGEKRKQELEAEIDRYTVLAQEKQK